MLKKADILLIALLLLLGGGLWLFTAFSSGTGGTAVVTVGGELYGEYALSEEREITVAQGDDVNVILVRDGAVTMKEANCPGGDCRRQGAISKAGESVVCLPHRIVIEIRSAESAYDAIVS